MFNMLFYNITILCLFIYCLCWEFASCVKSLWFKLNFSRNRELFRTSGHFEIGETRVKLNHEKVFCNHWSYSFYFFSHVFEVINIILAYRTGFSDTFLPVLENLILRLHLIPGGVRCVCALNKVVNSYATIKIVLC